MCKISPLLPLFSLRTLRNLRASALKNLFLSSYICMEIDAPLVRQLIAEQFPQWADLPVRAVQPNGWDNRTFRLGDELSVRLPSAAGYAPQVEKEARWLHLFACEAPARGLERG